MPEPTTVHLGLGANLGDREGAIREALRRLDQIPGVRVTAISSLRETAAFRVGPQPDYLNAAATLVTTLPATALHALLKQLERDAGRATDAPTGSPRVLDLDLLAFGDERIDTRDLVVPHPRLHEREFVLDPLRELGVDPATFPPPLQRPVVLHDVDAVAACTTGWLRGGCTIGLVPTMGALHEGHASLVRRARASCDRVLATIFVNPLQFGPNEDFDRYPRTLDADLALLRAAECDAVFVPERGAMVPPSFRSNVAAAPLADELEGASRPGHFGGVTTIVAKLFAITRPTDAFFGRKDAQQVALLRAMHQDLAFPLRLHECPTVREADGLALSSRNRYLAADDRRAAPILFRALDAMRARFLVGERDAAALLALGRGIVATEPRAKLDYLELRREGDLAPLATAAPSSARALVAAWFGTAPRTRLIDNVALAEPDLDPRVS